MTDMNLSVINETEQLIYLGNYVSSSLKVQL